MMNSTYLAELVSLQKSISKVFVLAVLAFCSPMLVSAQQALELEEFLNNPESNDKEIVSGFVFENVPTVIWKQGAPALDAPQNAQKLVSDVASLARVKGEDPATRSVKFFQINIENAAEKAQVRLTPDSLGSFTNLQYIFIQSQVALTPAELGDMVSGYEDGDIVFLFQVVSNF